MKNTILPETTLAMIVRDEIMNPAGGIERSLKSVLPHVEAAVVVDTGSIDGTCDVLSKLEKEYPYLKVYRREWDNFAPSRNFSLSKVETKKALVLDADEMIEQTDYKILVDFVKENPSWGYWFNFRSIYPDNSYLMRDGLLNIRLFDLKGVNGGEVIFEEGYKELHGAYEEFTCRCHRPSGKYINSPVEIKHFMPKIEAYNKKREQWYSGGGFLKMPPSETGRIDGWKEFNCKRDLFD